MTDKIKVFKVESTDFPNQPCYCENSRAVQCQIDALLDGLEIDDYKECGLITISIVTMDKNEFESLEMWEPS